MRRNRRGSPAARQRPAAGLAARRAPPGTTQTVDRITVCALPAWEEAFRSKVGTIPALLFPALGVARQQAMVGLNRGRFLRTSGTHEGRLSGDNRPSLFCGPRQRLQAFEQSTNARADHGRSSAHRAGEGSLRGSRFWNVPDGRGDSCAGWATAHGLRVPVPAGRAEQGGSGMSRRAPTALDYPVPARCDAQSQAFDKLRFRL